jgi:Ni/Co efflux regulator RcnB
MKKLLASLMLVAFVTVTSAAYAGTAFQGGDKDKKEDKDKDKDKKGKKGKKGHKGGKKGKKGSDGTTTPPPK